MGDNICIPTAGLLASLGMFVVSQMRTMASLGKMASIISLVALLIVIVLCLQALQSNNPTELAIDLSPGIWRKLSAAGSIGFCVGSQKLFLNIRHELADRNKAPQSLAIGLSLFGFTYVTVVLLAGDQAPEFLFDAIPAGPVRRLAGLLLWMHVVVSYAINSQALCSSLDRLYTNHESDPALRWMALTAILAVAAYLVANAIPFFADLVSLIGAMTSVPLTLTLPAVFWRRANRFGVWTPSFQWSYGLLVFGMIFTVTATLGSIYAIRQDWARHLGPPFACR